MTAATSQKLADVLRDAGFAAMALRAEQDEFHDYLSPHPFPVMKLTDELRRLASDTSLSERARLAAHHIRERVMNDEFEASNEEADEWAKGPDGQEVFSKLTKRPKR